MESLIDSLEADLPRGRAISRRRARRQGSRDDSPAASWWNQFNQEAWNIAKPGLQEQRQKGWFATRVTPSSAP